MLAAHRFEEWRAAGKEGRKNLDAALDQAVSEIVEKYEIVYGCFAVSLTPWIGQCVDAYFDDKAAEASRETSEQARQRWARIEAAREGATRGDSNPLRVRATRRDHHPFRGRIDEYLTQLRAILEYTKQTNEMLGPSSAR